MLAVTCESDLLVVFAFKWIKEINEHAVGAPIILLGCKKDSADHERLEAARNWVSA